MNFKISLHNIFRSDQIIFTHQINLLQMRRGLEEQEHTIFKNGNNILMKKLTFKNVSSISLGPQWDLNPLILNLSLFII